MGHENLQWQYKDDVERHGADAYKLWEFKSLGEQWETCLFSGPEWRLEAKYRRKEPPFKPEEFSGLNYRDAEPLVGRAVEGSCGGDNWEPTILLELNTNPCVHPKFNTEKGSYYYIKTTPQTCVHPNITLTVNGIECKLPMPEMEAPKLGTKFFYLNTYNIVCCDYWHNNSCEQDWLRLCKIHLTLPRAQAWASWKENVIMAAVRGDKK